MSRTARLTVLGLSLVLLAALGFGYTLHAADRARSGRDRPHAVPDLNHPAQILFRSTAPDAGRDHLAALDVSGTGRPEGDDDRRVSDLKCLVFHAAHGTGLCLQLANPVLNAYDAVILDARARPVAHHRIAGTPSRARVSPGGHMVAWTSFVGGESYAGLNFSTRTAILDTRTGTLLDNLEEFTVRRDGQIYRAPDINVWGVTFAADENRFYATVASDGHTYLAQGDIAAETLTTVHENAECPSLSPDGTRVAYKKRVSGTDPARPWRLFVLDLRTRTETPVADTRELDDQAEWLDADTVVYMLPGDQRGDVWASRADGSGTPRLLLRYAMSPAVLRG